MAFDTSTYEMQHVILVNYLGRKVDVRNIFEALTISQSIFNSTMYGDMIINDSEDLHTGLPFIGEEKLLIKYRTGPDLPWIEQEFLVYAVSDKIKSAENASNFTVSFCSPEMIKNQFQVVSVAFTSKTVKQAVGGVFKYLDTKKPVDVEDTVGNINFIVPSWSPIKTINNLAGKAQSKEHAGASFLFWETPVGFKFKSLETLYQQDPIKYSYASLQGTHLGETALYNITRLHQVKAQNVLDSIPKGLFGGTAFTIDPLTRSFSVVDFDYNRDFAKLKHVEKSADDQKLTSNKWPFKDVAKFGVYKQILGRNRTGEWLKKGQNFDQEWFTKEKTLLARMSHLQQATNHIKLRMEAQGNTKVEAGHIISINLPDQNTFKADDPVRRENHLYSGRYLVTAVANVFTQSTFISYFELTKDCYKQSPDDELREELFR